MNLKTEIKNNLSQFNYIIPFVKKHQFDEKGKVALIKDVLDGYRNIKCIKSKENTPGNNVKEILSVSNIHIDDNSHYVYFLDTKKTIPAKGNVLSNFTLDYDRIIHGSFIELFNKAFGDDEYGKESKAVYEGVKRLRDRIAEELNASSLKDNNRKIKYFSRMLEEPAEHFDEALQRILFFNQILWQTRHRLNGLGRLDKILDDLYKSDISSKYITKDESNDLIFDFLNQLSKYPGYKSDALEGDIGQIIILGGLDPDGTYFSNELTEIFLNQQAKLGKPDPKTLIRVSKKMPDKLIEIVVKALLSKTGSPLFSNDDVVIKALKDFGMPDEDAYSYCVSACWEPYIVGKSLDQNNISVFDFFNALDETLGQVDIKSFDELKNKYILLNEKKFKDFLITLNQNKWAKDPFVSLFMDECSDKREDVSLGSTVYNNYGITTVGLSNVVDSLLNIKKLVYGDKELTLEELNSYRMDNFSNDDLFKKINSLKKHYGHQDDDSIELTNEITSSLSLIANDFKNKLNGTVKFGVSSPAYNILSKKTNADVSGRKKGMPYNTHISALDASYTEVVGFASQLKYDNQRFNGNVVDFFVSPDFINNNIDKFKQFLKGAIRSGFFQMQMNIMDSKTLIDAKTNPDKYKGLIVRVWGFSAYFNDLPESYKDLLIQRAISAEYSN